MTLLDLLLYADQESPYNDKEKLWLRAYRRNHLLQAQPLLLLLLQYYAEKERWRAKQRMNIAMLPDAETLLQQLQLSCTERTLWLCQYVTELSETYEVVHYAQSELKALTICFQHGCFESVETHAIKPKVEFVVGLAKLLSKHPELATARFINRKGCQRLCFDLAEFKVQQIKQTAIRLGNLDSQQKLLRCRHQSDLNGLANRLEHQISEQIMQTLQSVDLDDLAAVYDACQPYLNDQQRLGIEDHWYERYPLLPWASHECILPITDYQQLFLEAHQQLNCALNYRSDLANNEYALFKVLEPERATLGLKWSPKQQRFQFDQLVAKNNQAVNIETRRYVKRWLKRAQR
ncbi:MAG: hypothetical protein M0R33_21065 [Methylomonas sp.]|jgi:hypothetical protein|uniref:hypothetical protein n=1 Tax=Methylomonas sp. TaxID=418 RepID=UPI0025E653D3|nr:hypothetical protein [Methylomonas sp.]MCK9608937.1 hypothetical protein [Methylomonas sp.]